MVAGYQNGLGSIDFMPAENIFFNSRCLAKPVNNWA